MTTIVRWMVSICRANRPQPERQHPAYQGPGMDKKIPALVLRKIFRECLTHQERCLVSPTCTTLQNYLCMDGFGLVIGKCRMVFIQNAPPFGGSGSLGVKFGTPLPFTCFDYDPQSQCVMTGDASDYSSDADVRIWDRNGKMVRELKGSHLDKRALSVHLSAQNNVACCASVNGVVRMWDLRTGERLVSESHPTLTAISPDLQTRSFVYGSNTGRVYLAEQENGSAYKDRSMGSFLIRHRERVVWLSQIPQSHGVVSYSADSVLKVWDRTTGECVKTFESILPAPILDADTRQLVLCRENEMWMIGPSSERHWSISFAARLAYPRQVCTALHYDPTKKWLFAAFNLFYRGGRYFEGRRIVVWDTESGVEHPNCDRFNMNGLLPDINQIDFDPKTNTFLLAAKCVVQLRDFNTGREIRQFAGLHSHFRWDKTNKLIILFRGFDGLTSDGLPIGGTLSLLDYSGAAPSQRLESKEDSKEQPKKE